MLPIAWPARSPNLTPMDFFIWGTQRARCTAHVSLVCEFWKKTHHPFLWKESSLKCVATLSGHLHTGRTPCKQQQELKSKRSELEKGGGKDFISSCSSCENCTLLARFTFSTKMFKNMHSFSNMLCICSTLQPRLGHSYCPLETELHSDTPGCLQFGRIWNRDTPFTDSLLLCIGSLKTFLSCVYRMWVSICVL